MIPGCTGPQGGILLCHVVLNSKYPAEVAHFDLCELFHYPMRACLSTTKRTILTMAHWRATNQHGCWHKQPRMSTAAGTGDHQSARLLARASAQETTHVHGCWHQNDGSSGTRQKQNGQSSIDFRSGGMLEAWHRTGLCAQAVDGMALRTRYSGGDRSS